MNRKAKRVEIFGAGLSGLVAAIHLARRGYEVHVCDREDRIGGRGDWHPSVQTTVLDVEKTSRYLEINLTDCFSPLKSITFYRYGRRDVFYPQDMVVCERGPRPTSLDSALARVAVAHGVRFHFGCELTEERLRSETLKIMATGLDPKPYKLLGIPADPVYGYRALMKSDRDGVLLSYMMKCTNYDFAYLAVSNGLLFGLLFSRNRLEPQNLENFTEILKKTERIEFRRWDYSAGNVPRRAQLLAGDKVLAGTISGMIDPFLLHGVSGALVSGRIAARAVEDPVGASKEFALFGRNFGFKSRLKRASTLLPWKSRTVPLFMWLDSHFRGVGFVR